MAQELDLTRLTVTREAPYRHPAGPRDRGWTCPVCRTGQDLERASLVRVRDEDDPGRYEFALVVCGTCREVLRHRRHQPAEVGRHEVAARAWRRRDRLGVR